MTTTTRSQTSSDARTPDGFWYDPDAAEDAVRFFRLFLRHVKGEWAGQPLILQDWAANEIVRPLFGWKRRDGLRRYRTVYVEVPRKNAKSTIAAGIGLYLTFYDNEPGAEVVSAAADREQAAIVFDVAKTMVEEEPDLKKQAQVFRRSIAIRRTNSSYKVISADAYTKHGLNLHGIIFDELHAQPNRELWDVLTTSVGARRQPVTFAITTAGFDRNSICWEVHEYAMKVKDGLVDDPTFLPVLYGVPEDMDWRSDEALVIANPGLGVTVNREYLEMERSKAIETPGYQNTFRRLHLNQWTEQDSRWLDMGVWDDQPERRSLEELKGKGCFAALDLSTRYDITALVLVFPGDDGSYDVVPYFWIPEDNIRERVQRDHVPYDVWERDGFIEATPGNLVDQRIIKDRISQLRSQYKIREIPYDPWNAAYIEAELSDVGAPLVQVTQNFQNLSAPSKELAGLLTSRKIRHGNNPVLRWMASNVVVVEDTNGNLRPHKGKSTDRIDGISALVMGLLSNMRQQEPTWSGIYIPA